MCKTKEEKCKVCAVTFVVCLFTSLALIIGGFFVPPMGVIDGSVLTAVGELLLFQTLLYSYRAIKLECELTINAARLTFTRISPYKKQVI